MNHVKSGPEGGNHAEAEIYQLLLQKTMEDMVTADEGSVILNLSMRKELFNSSFLGMISQQGNLGEFFFYELKVPVNTEAKVTFPGMAPGSLYVNGLLTTCSPEGIELGSGCYTMEYICGAF